MKVLYVTSSSAALTGTTYKKVSLSKKYDQAHLTPIDAKYMRRWRGGRCSLSLSNPIP